MFVVAATAANSQEYLTADRRRRISYYFFPTNNPARMKYFYVCSQLQSVIPGAIQQSPSTAAAMLSFSFFFE